MYQQNFRKFSHNVICDQAIAIGAFDTGELEMSTKNKPECLTRALIQLMLRNPFFTMLAMKCPFVQDDERSSTMATDGRNYYYNRKFVESLEEEELIGLLAHEICHNAFQHSFRKMDRDHERFNRAADYVINPLLIDGFGFSLPKGGLYDQQYCDMTAESVYELLGSGNDTEASRPSWGEVLDFPDLNDAKELAIDWDVSMRQAAQAAQQAGKLPSALARLVNLQDSQVDWTTVLRSFIIGTGAEDLSWRKFNRQHGLRGFYVPDFVGTKMGAVVIGIDTSGSIDDFLLGRFLGEVSAILQDCQPEIVYVVYCDSAINHVDDFTVQDLPITPRAVGGGGTSFCPVFDWIEAQDIFPDRLIYMTDLCGDFPSQPDYPVLWARTDARINAPYGEYIDLRINV